MIIEQRTMGAVLSEVEAEAQKRNKTPEEFLDELLTAYRADETGGMELGPKHFREIQVLLGAGISTSRELVDRIRRLVTLQVESTRVRLSPMCIERLNTRKRHLTMSEYLKQLVPLLLEQWTGMR